MRTKKEIEKEKKNLQQKLSELSVHPNNQMGSANRIDRTQIMGGFLMLEELKYKRYTEADLEKRLAELEEAHIAKRKQFFAEKAELRKKEIWKVKDQQKSPELQTIDTELDTLRGKANMLKWILGK